MRTFTLLFSALVLGTAAQAQTVATFEDLTLTKADTSYINYTSSGNDVGFDDGLAHFPCVYDTDYGGYWSNGFSYSNWTDSVTSGYTNQYSAKTAIGYASSPKYVIGYGVSNIIELTGAAVGKKVSGFYATNTTYAYNSMLNGDSYAKKFGGTTGTDPDWFKITVQGYSGGALTAASVDFYLADFRFASSDSDYIVRTWKWVDLLPLGNVDSLQFTLSSTDTAGGFGMNTPAYFSMDNFSTDENPSTSVAQVSTAAAKVYPNPTSGMLYVDLNDNTTQQITVMDMAGHVISTYTTTSIHNEINTASLPAGTYLLQLSGNGKSGTTRFVKN